jgi:centrosomal protein CEP152
MSRNQSQENLVESKGKLIELKDVNEKLVSKIRLLENENDQLVGEMESTKLMLSDVQTKYNMVEKSVMFNAERNTDLIIKQSQERHSAQMAMMQQQIDNIKKKYDDLEHDYKHLDIRYKELQKSREAMLIEKSEIINQLSKSLEESQRQCQDLLQRPDLMHENKRLQIAIQAVECQKDEMSLTISKLQKRVHEQNSEIETMDSIMNECSKNNQSFAEISNFVNREPLKNVNSSTPVTADTKLSKVMDELIKSQNNIRMKREEIKILEKQLAEKNDEISSMRCDENKLLIDLNKYKDEALKLENKMSLMQKEIINSASDKEENERLLREIDMKTNECEDLRAKIDSMKLCEVEINRKLENKEEQLRAMTQELDDALLKSRDQNPSLQTCEKCEEYATKLGKVILIITFARSATFFHFLYSHF